jgi:hypothetical protein
MGYTFASGLITKIYIKMKRIALFSILAVIITALIVGYLKVSAVKTFVDKYFLGKVEVVNEIIPNYNVVLIADGTDIKHNEYAVPIVNIDYVSNFAEKIQQYGCGRLWFGYVDENSENNELVYLDIKPIPQFTNRPERIGGEPKSQYDTRVKQWEEEHLQYQTDSIKFCNNRQIIMSDWLEKVQELVDIAYSEKIANNKRGSDVFGATNAAIRALKTVPQNSIVKKYIVLVSDGHDNIKKTLDSISDDIELLLVNNSGSKSSFGINALEFDGLSRMEEYVFKK